MEWVTVRHARTNNTARVPRSALPQMPKWCEVKASKTSGRKAPETDADTSSADREE